MINNIRYAMRTDIGQVRDENQDSIYGFVAPPSEKNPDSSFGLFIVADGMGSHEQGVKTATLTLETVSQYVLNHLYIQWLEGTLSHDASAILEILRQAVVEANRRIYDAALEGCSTIIATLIVKSMVCIVHVGDSRAYLITDYQRDSNILIQLTKDHTLFERILSLGPQRPNLEPVEYDWVLYQAVGQSENLEVGIRSEKLELGDYILLCSDALWKTVTEYELVKTVCSYSPENIELQTRCDKLVALAKQRSNDNISVILVVVD